MDRLDPRIYSTHLKPLPHSPRKHNIQTTKTNFHDLLTSQIQKTDSIKLSKHAEKRLEERGIVIDSDKWSQIEAKVNEAKRKGVNDSIVVLDNAALIVNARSNTVITALDKQEAASQIFTNINGTIII